MQKKLQKKKQKNKLGKLQEGSDYKIELRCIDSKMKRFWIKDSKIDYPLFRAFHAKLLL